MKKINSKKILASFFTFVMTFQATSGVFEVAAKELGKIKLADQYGEYYKKNNCLGNIALNKENQVDEKASLKKEPTILNKQTEYDGSLEVTKKRTANSKTYKLSDGTYVEETYFEAVHKKVGGEFVEIDNTLKDKSMNRSTPIYENKDGAYDFSLQDNIVKVTNKNRQAISIINETGDLDTYSTKENVILYSNVYKNIDMEYRLGGGAVYTSFYVNGDTDINDISYRIAIGDLEVKEYDEYLAFIDKNGEIIFTYDKPRIQDNTGQTTNVNFSYIIKNQELQIKIQLPTNWLVDENRVYPVKMFSRASDESVEINVNSAYISSNLPDRHSEYYDLFIGYDDGPINGVNINLGATRTYMSITNLNLGNNKKIIKADLQLWKKLRVDNQWNTVEVRKSDGYVDVSKVKWSNKPNNLTSVSTTTIGDATGWQSFDITSYINDIYKGKNNAIELKATNESSSYWANVFYGESGAAIPKVTITYRDDFDINPDLIIDIMDADMRVYAKENIGFYGLSFDGIAKPDSDISFGLVERDKDTIIKNEVAMDKSNRYLISPIFEKTPLPNVQTQQKRDVNYSTNYILAADIPNYDVPYEYLMKVKQGNTYSTKEFRSDAIIKYKVKLGDTLKSISSYYGVSITDIKADNNLKKDVVKQDDVLIIRIKKDNPKVSKDVYTPPVRVTEYKAKYVNRGPRCYGTCEIIDPVNPNIGNYFHESTDFTVTDYDELPFNRYYNSVGPVVSGMFGNGFTTSLESYISYDKDENILFFKGDGKVYQIKKSGNDYIPNKEDKLEISKTKDTTLIKHLESKETFTFDSYGTLISIAEENGHTIQIEYDSYGLINKMKLGSKDITFEYNNIYLVKAIILPDGSKVTYQYDDKRNLIKYTDTSNNSETYYYDNDRLSYIFNKNGNKTASNMYDQEGRVTKQIDANGNITTLSYKNNKTIVLNSDGSEDTYQYNGDYKTIGIIENGVETSKYTYDEYGNIATKIDQDGKETKYTYNKNDLLKVEYPNGTYEQYRYDNNHNVIYYREMDGKETTYQYVGSDLVASNNSANDTNQYYYDDKHRVIKEINALGISKEYEYQDASNQVKTIRHNNGYVETYRYDANGNIVQQSDSQGKTIDYIYNSQGQVLQKNYYDGTNEKWQYDALGNITVYQDRMQTITTMTYDKNNNLIKSIQGNLETTKEYDSLNRIVSETNEQGLVTKYTYDEMGNQNSEIDIYGNVIEYTYDNNGNLIKTKDAFGNEEVSVYNNDDLVKTISKEGLETTYTYDELHREIEKVLPNGKKNTKEYDTIGRVIKEYDEYDTSVEHIYDSNGREIETITTYQDGKKTVIKNTYDIYDNLIAVDKDGAITTYSYDVYNQQITITDPLQNTIRMEYDLDGNVIKEIDAMNQATIKKYDANGNLIASTDKNGNTTTNQYNQNSLLISETDSLGYVTTYTYNDKGQMIETIDPYQTVTSYYYNQYSQLVEVTVNGTVIKEIKYDTNGREIYVDDKQKVIETKYDTLNRKEKVINALTGLEIIYNYDAFGNVILERDSNGLEKTYTYDIYQRVIATTDEYNRKEEKEYDIRNHEIKIKNYDGTVVRNEYDINGNIVTSIDGLGIETRNIYNANNQLIETKNRRVNTIYTYNANGLVTQTDTNGVITKSVYDANGNVIDSIDGLGNSTKTIYDAKNQVIETIDAMNNSTKQEYDGNSNVVKKVDALGNSKSTVYDEYGQVVIEIDERGFSTEYIYNKELQLVETKDKLGNSQILTYNDQKLVSDEKNQNGAITKYQYDDYSRVIETISPNGKKNTKEYDSLGNVIHEIDEKRNIITKYDRLGNKESVSINDVIQEQQKYNTYNQVIESFDANGNKSEFIYDQYGQVVYANEKGYKTVKEYDAFGNIIKQIDNDSYILEHTYNSNNQLLKTKTNTQITLEKKYDSVGNEVKIIENNLEKQMQYDALYRITALKIPSVANKEVFINYQTITYDEVGNPITIEDANKNVEKRIYDANNNVISYSNKKGVTNLYEYDSLGNLLKVQDGNERYVTYSYDVNNNVSYKKINDKLTTYTYDSNDNLLKEENEYGYINTYEYDNFDRKISHTMPNKTKINYQYDALGNVLEEGSNTYQYDSRNNKISATNQHGTITYQYNDFNQMITTKDTKDNIVEYQYNHNQQLVSKKYKGIEVTYHYNQYAMMDAVSKEGKELANYTYNHRGEVSSIYQGNVITNKQYDDMGKLTSLETIKDKQRIYQAQYSYDNNDNLIKEIVNDKENSYQYNEYDELVDSVKYLDNKYIHTSYSYDVFGNQLVSNSEVGDKKYSYNDKNQVEKITTAKQTIDFEYDDNGNLISKKYDDGDKETYEYDDFNMLLSMQQGQYVYDYIYDGDKQRIGQEVTDLKDYHYDVWYDYTVPLDIVSDEKVEDAFDNVRNQQQRLSENKGLCSSTLSDSYDVEYYKEKEITLYTLDRNQEYATVLASNDELSIYGQTLLQKEDEILITGLNDSVVTSIEGSNVQKYHYDDYGKTKEIDKGYSYNGEIKDSNGLLYLRARYYDPDMGRFIQYDANYGGEQTSVVSQNRYTYTLNNPYKYVDRSGNEVDGGGSNERADKPWLYMSAAKFKAYCRGKPLSKVLAMNAERIMKEETEKARQKIIKQQSNILNKNKPKIKPSKPGVISGKNTSSIKMVNMSVIVPRKIHNLQAVACPKDSDMAKNYIKMYLKIRDIPYIKEAEAYRKLGLNNPSKRVIEECKNGIKILIGVWKQATVDNINISTVEGYVRNNYTIYATDVVKYSKELVEYMHGQFGEYRKVETYTDSSGKIKYGYFHRNTEVYDAWNNDALKFMRKVEPHIITAMSLYNMGALSYIQYKRQIGAWNQGSVGNESPKTPVSGAEWEQYFKQKYGQNNVEWLTKSGYNPYFTGGGYVPIQNLGSTGRNVALDVQEQMAMDATRRSPFNGETFKVIDDMTGDSRWQHWQKWQVTYRTENGRTITIHFNYEPKNGLFDDFKFK